MSRVVPARQVPLQRDELLRAFDGRDFLSLHDLSAAELEALLDLAAEVKTSAARQGPKFCPLLR